MKLVFELEGKQFEFARNWFTGRCTLKGEGEDREMVSPWDPRTHFSLGLERHLQFPLQGHTVAIDKERPLLFAGVRPQTYRLFVDGRLVQERTGY